MNTTSIQSNHTAAGTRPVLPGGNEVGQKCWHSLACEHSRVQRHPIWSGGAKLIAISKRLGAMQLLLLLALALVACCPAARGRLLVRRSHSAAVAGELGPPAAQGQAEGDEEVLTIGRQERAYDETTNTHTGSQQQRHHSQAQKRESELVDPFVFTFEDYLREASSGGGGGGGAGRNFPGGGGGDAGEENRIAPPSLQERAPSTQLIDEEQEENNGLGERQQRQQEQPVRPSQRASLIIEDDEAPGASASASAAADHKQENNHQGNNNEDAVALAALREIKLLFAWRALPTNKCSRACGRGARLNHLSCVDLKFNVRVESELCERAQLARPGELSDEPCNEHDCEPAWREVVTGSGASPAGSLFKRLECAMLDRTGALKRLDETLCNNTARTLAADTMESVAATTTTTTTTTVAPWETSNNNKLEEEFSIDLSEERNSILAHEVPLEALGGGAATSAEQNNRWRHQQDDQDHGQVRPRSNEPFWEPGAWGECAGAPCGQLGARTRKLACRLYLARSAKLVDLPESSCRANGLRALDRQEPCYMDCGPSGRTTTTTTTTQENNNTSELHHRSQVELEDETIYDLEVARYAWRHAAWTKCSAECLGGRHESLVECWDRVTEAGVDEGRGLCDPGAKPAPLQRACNEVPCAPEWRLGPFSECTRPCGSAGVRSRTVACVQQVPPGYQPPVSLASSVAAGNLPPPQPAVNPHQRHQHHQLLLVPNELCLEQQRQQVAATVTGRNTTSQQQQLQQHLMAPHSIEPCNRRDCRPEWQLGPWARECSRACGAGLRNRTAICVQEFASRDGPLALEANVSHAIVSPDLREALQLAAGAWHPGKAIQVPLSECYRESHSVPALSEPCQGRDCPPVAAAAAAGTQGEQDSSARIDSDPQQDFRMMAPDGRLLPWVGGGGGRGGVSLKRKQIALKIGGHAQLLEGRTVKIRCRILAGPNAAARWRHETPVEWRLNGVRVFAPNTTMAEKQPLQQQQPIEDEDNSILSGAQVEDTPQAGDDKWATLMAADEPPEARRSSAARRNHRAAGQGAKARVLSVRSWPTGELPTSGGSGASSSSSPSFQFVPQAGGRFALVRENILRIKRLRPDDSGTYTCSSGPLLSESMELTVVSRRARKQQAAASAAAHDQLAASNYT